MKGLGNSWLSESIEKNMILAIRKNTKKIILIYEGEVTYEIEKYLMRFWVKFGIHPFIFNDNKFFDMISGEFINKI